ncbi:MAG TPA: hypothetical protein VHZ50_00615, partial [Puia sp.]|nr:hypothetical protein [Puia sp.]
TLIVIIGIISINHPIILKWLTGSARLIGKQINATVYANNQINNDIKVFHVSKYWNNENADYYILYLINANEKDKLRFFSLNKKDNYAGKPSSTNIRDCDFILGQLFQSEVGAKFINFQDDIKGFNFNPKLIFEDNQIKLNIPPSEKELKCDSLKIQL